MKLHLQVVSVLCALLWPACFSSLVALNRNFDSENEEVVRIVPNVHSPTNFWALPSSSVAITAPTVSHEPTNAKNSLAKAMSTSESVSSSESSSSSSQTRGVVTSTAINATTSMAISSSSSSNTKAPATSTHYSSPGTPTATVSPPGSYTPPPVPVPTTTTAHNQPTPTMHSTGCGPPITVTVNNGAHCTNTPSPPQACSSDCTSKIGLSLGISIPGTAILTFLVTALSCLCCQRVKKKHSYIQLAPTVYFDEEEHD
jgi:hypothetical protein